MALKINQDGLSERINVLVNEAGMTNRRFALSVGIDPSGFDKKTKGIQPWTVNDVNKLMQQYDTSAKLMKQMSKGGLKLPKGMGGMRGLGGLGGLGGGLGMGMGMGRPGKKKPKKKKGRR